MRIAGRLNGPADSAHADVACDASAGVRRWDIPAGLDPLPLGDAEHIEQGHASSQENLVDAHAIPICVGPDGESSARGRPTWIRRAEVLS